MAGKSIKHKFVNAVANGATNRCTPVELERHHDFWLGALLGAHRDG